MAKAAEWVERIKAWQESGLKAEEFAKGKGFRAKTLVWWSSELKRREKRVGSRAVPKHTPRGGKSLRMARVIPAPSKPVGTLTVRVGGAAVELERGFDHELLAEVVRALRGGR